MNENIFSRFSDDAKKILISAQKIAETEKTGIGSEHLLLALLISPNNQAYDILREHKLSYEPIKLVIKFNNLKTHHSRGISPELTRIFTIAAKKAYEFENSEIYPGHLLWAILSESESLAYQILIRAGADIELIKQSLENLFHQNEDILSANFKPTDQTSGMPQMGGLPEIFPALENLYAGIATKNSQRHNSKSKTPFLDEFGLDLTLEAKNNKLDPVIGREKELTRIIQVLCRRKKNNPILIGDPGVGKTAVVEGLARKISTGDVPPQIKDKKIFLLDLSLLVAGTMYRGQFEERLKKIIKEIINTKNVIIFIDEIHTIVGTGSAEGSMDAANILKPQLAKGTIRLIGATTFDEYRKHIEKDAALERRMQKIEINEPTVAQTIKILKGLRDRYEKHHQVKITDGALISASELGKRYINDRFLPDKAIDLIDEAASATHVNERAENYELLTKKERELENIIAKKEKLIEQQDFQKALLIRNSELKLRNELAILNQKTKPLKTSSGTIIDSESIAKIVSLWSGVPLSNLLNAERKKLLNLDKEISKQVLGQDEAIKIIAQAIKKARAGVSNPNRPIGAFMFLGPTGVGKTELAKVLANKVFGSQDNLIKLDMSEFMEKHTVSRLVGAPPGYVGYEEAGKLTEQVRRKPYSLILFDEIEKAHPEVFNILLQIMEDGYLTDAKGKRANFKNTIIILTSNIGIKELTHQAAIGFKGNDTNTNNKNDKKYELLKEKVLTELKEKFRPEFLNRLDNIIIFRPLGYKAIIKIVKLQIDELISRVFGQKIALRVTNNVIDFIAKKGYDPEFGARPIRRAIADYIENPLAEKILTQEIQSGDDIKIILENNNIDFKKHDH